MKKIIMMCFMLVILLVLVGCNNEDEKENYGKELLSTELKENKNLHTSENYANNLDEKVVIEIKQNYLNTYLKNDVSLDDIEIEVYYGRYNNNEVILINELNKGDTGVITEITIDGIIFKYIFGNREILLWDGTKFYNLLEAYEAKIIFKDDLEKIKNIHNEKIK